MVLIFLIQSANPGEILEGKPITTEMRINFQKSKESTSGGLYFN